MISIGLGSASGSLGRGVLCSSASPNIHPGRNRPDEKGSEDTRRQPQRGSHFSIGVSFLLSAMSYYDLRRRVLLGRCPLSKGSTVAHLPDDCWLSVLAFLAEEDTASDIASVAAVCRSFYTLLGKPCARFLWPSRFYTERPLLPGTRSPIWSAARAIAFNREDCSMARYRIEPRHYACLLLPLGELCWLVQQEMRSSMRMSISVLMVVVGKDEYLDPRETPIYIHSLVELMTSGRVRSILVIGAHTRVVASDVERELTVYSMDPLRRHPLTPSPYTHRDACLLVTPYTNVYNLNDSTYPVLYFGSAIVLGGEQMATTASSKAVVYSQGRVTTDLDRVKGYPGLKKFMWKHTKVSMMRNPRRLFHEAAKYATRDDSETQKETGFPRLREIIRVGAEKRKKRRAVRRKATDEVLMSPSYKRRALVGIRVT